VLAVPSPASAFPPLPTPAKCNNAPFSHVSHAHASWPVVLFQSMSLDHCQPWLLFHIIHLELQNQATDVDSPLIRRHCGCNLVERSFPPSSAIHPVPSLLGVQRSGPLRVTCATLASSAEWTAEDGRRSGLLTRRNELLRVILLLGRRLRESSKSSNNTPNHEDQRHDGPDDTPALRGTTISLRKDASIRLIYFAKDKVVTLFQSARFSIQ
jgi:hypothetical protein